MGIKGWLKKVEEKAKGEQVTIELEGGGEARFPREALSEAFLHELDRLKGEHDDVHPLTLAATNARDPELRNSAHAALTDVDADGNIMPPREVEDLSE